MEKADALVSLSEFLQNDKELANQVKRLFDPDSRFTETAEVIYDGPDPRRLLRVR